MSDTLRRISDAPGESRNSADVLLRLSRRGQVTIEADDGDYTVTFKAPGPYRGRAWCTTDEADLYEHCHLGAKDWRGEGRELASLLAECEEATRPRSRPVVDLVWEIERRRTTRTLGPPLPSYIRWDGWRPGQERWLRTSSHASEYLGGYLRYVEAERKFEDENLARARRSVAGGDRG